MTDIRKKGGAACFRICGEIHKKIIGSLMELEETVDFSGLFFCKRILTTEKG